MAYDWEFGNGLDEDITITFNIGADAANPKLRYDSGTAQFQIALNGVDFNNVGIASASADADWQTPFRIGATRIWTDESNSVTRYKVGSDPTSETDGIEWAGPTGDANFF